MDGYGFKYGHVAFPIAPEQQLLLACDPAVAKLLDFFSSQISSYCGVALTTAASTLATPKPILTEAVASTIPIDPLSIAKADQFGFPLLAVWRKTSRFDQRTMNWDQDTATLGVAYILPPMSAGHAVRLQPILTAVSRVLHRSVVQGFDPTYRDGERVFASIETARTRLTSGTFARFEFGDTIDFHAFVGEIELHEQTMPFTDGLSDLIGTDLTITDESVEPGNPIDVIDETLGS